MDSQLPTSQVKNSTSQFNFYDPQGRPYLNLDQATAKSWLQTNTTWRRSLIQMPFPPDTFGYLL